MVGVTLKRDFDINRKLANLSVRVEYLERRTLALEARGQFQAYTPGFLNATGTVEEARWTRLGNLVHVWASLDLATVTGVIEVDVPFPILLPAEPRRSLGTAMARAAAASGLNVDPGHVIADPSATAVSFVSSDMSGVWQAGSPFVWSSGSVLAFETTYETDAA
jgi:hypothetical protein